MGEVTELFRGKRRRDPGGRLSHMHKTGRDKNWKIPKVHFGGIR